MPASTVVQAVIGGITVLTGLLWWTVAIHLLGVDDDGVAGGAALRQGRRARRRRGGDARAEAAAPVDASQRCRRWRRCWSPAPWSPAPGPHAGDKSIEQPVPRLQVEITTLVHMHSSLLVAYLSLLVGLGFALLAVHAPRPVLTRLGVLVALVAAQGLRRHACSSSPASRRRWWRSTSRARRPAPPPLRRYGRRCDNGPSPSRSRADSTPSANSRCRAPRSASSSCRQPRDGSTSSSSSSVRLAAVHRSHRPGRRAARWRRCPGGRPRRPAPRGPTSHSSKSGFGGRKRLLGVRAGRRRTPAPHRAAAASAPW